MKSRTKQYYLRGRKMRSLLLIISAIFIFVSAGCTTAITTGAAKNRAQGQQQQVEATQVELERQRAEIERIKKLDEFVPDW